MSTTSNTGANNNGNQGEDYTDLPRVIKITRELAILGDYGQAIEKYKLAFQIINKVNEKSKSFDSYLQSRMRQLSENLTGEFNMVCNHHRDLLLLQDPQSMIDESLYQVPGQEVMNPGLGPGRDNRPLPTNQKRGNGGANVGANRGGPQARGAN